MFCHEHHTAVIFFWNKHCWRIFLGTEEFLTMLLLTLSFLSFWIRVVPLQINRSLWCKQSSSCLFWAKDVKEFLRRSMWFGKQSRKTVVCVEVAFSRMSRKLFICSKVMERIKKMVMSSFTTPWTECHWWKRSYDIFYQQKRIYIKKIQD